MYEQSNDFATGYAVGRDSNNNGNNGWGGFGGDWSWWIIILLIFGWGGNNGFGGAFGGGYGGGQFMNYEIGKLATTNDVASGFSTSTILSNQRDLQLALQDGFSNVQSTLCQGFSGVNATVNAVGNTINQGICNLGYNLQGSLNGISREISDCCCSTQRLLERGFADTNYNLAKNTCDIQNTIQHTTRDIIDSQREGTDKILAFLTNEKICGLQAENAALTAQLSQNAQTSTLLRAINKCPEPAYIVPNPYCCYGTTYGYNPYGQQGNGCGCNTCC